MILFILTERHEVFIYFRKKCRHSEQTTSENANKKLMMGAINIDNFPLGTAFVAL